MRHLWSQRLLSISRKVGSDKACKWHSDGSNGYSLDDAERGEEGTDIILHLKKDAKEFLEEQRISYMVKKQAIFLLQYIGKMVKQALC